MSDPFHPGVMTRMRAAWRGERSAVALEAMRRAGKPAYEELLRAERLRAEVTTQGGSLWDCPPAVCSQLLAGWNAFVLQTLSEAFLDTDYTAAPGTVGYVPPMTFEQVWEWLSGVEGWLSRAEQGRRNPDYDVSEELALPAALPDWVDPCPREHLSALVTALPAIRGNAELALYNLQRNPVPPGEQRSLNRLAQLAGEAASAADYALALRANTEDPRLNELIEANLKRGVEAWFDVGQLAAMPALLKGYQVPVGGVRPDPATMPGGARFDPWCLTDPRTREMWRRDRDARAAIKALWAADPNPAATIALHAEIEAAVDRGDLIRIRTGDGGYCYYRCPWVSLYEVRRPVRLAGRSLKVLRQFTLDVCADGLAEGKPFTRELVFGPFEHTNEVDY